MVCLYSIHYIIGHTGAGGGDGGGVQTVGESGGGGGVQLVGGSGGGGGVHTEEGVEMELEYIQRR